MMFLVFAQSFYYVKIWGAANEVPQPFPNPWSLALDFSSFY